MNFFKKFWVVVLIFLVWSIFASPYFLKNKVPFSSTYLVNFFAPWNAYPGFASPVKNNAMPDVISQILPWKTLTIDTFKNLQIPLWNPYSFSGTPHLANYQSAVLSPFNLLFFILPFIDAWSILVLLQPLLAGLFMYLFLKSLKISNYGVAIGSLSFMFCGFIVSWMAYATLAFAILFLPLALYAIEKYYDSQKIKFLILFSLTFPLSFFSGHFQISIYFFLFVAAYIFFKYLQTKNAKNTLSLVFFSFIGLLLSLPQLLPSIELYTQTLRSGIFQKSEVIPWSYLPTLIAPDFFGNPVTRNDWFGHYAEWNGYIGVLPLMLAFYAVFFKRTKIVLYFTFFFIIAILLCFKTPLVDLLVFLKIPVLSTSALSRVIVIFSFSLSVLASFGFDLLINDLKNKNLKRILSWLLLFLLIFVFLWSIILLKLFIPVDKVLIAKQNFILPSVIFIFSFFIIFLSLFAFKIKAIKKYAFLLFIILIFIVGFDMLRFANKWMPFDPKDKVFPKIVVDKKLHQISGYNRVFGNLGGEATVYYKLSSLEGYDAVYIKRYGEFIASLSNGKLQQSARSVVSFPKNGLYREKAINLLGVKHIVHKTADGRSPWVFPFWEYKDGVLPRIYNDGVYEIFENKEAYPRAFLVGNYIVESNQQKILDKMFAKDFNLRKEVVLEKDPKLNLDGSLGSVSVLSYTPNQIELEALASGNSLLFLSDTFYNGWNAYLDNKKITIYRADYAFRAVYVPKGKHQVVFKYEPLSFKIGLIGALLGLVAIVVVRKRVI